MRKNISIGEVIAWIGLVLLIIWIILKLSGLIKTPLIFEIAPIITLCLILGGLLVDIRNTKTEIRDIKSNTSKIANSLIKLGYDFRELKGEHEIIKNKKH